MGANALRGASRHFEEHKRRPLSARGASFAGQESAEAPERAKAEAIQRLREFWIASLSPAMTDY